MTALRFQTEGRHQTSPASLRGQYWGKCRKAKLCRSVPKVQTPDRRETSDIPGLPSGSGLSKVPESDALPECARSPNSKQWFTTSFFQEEGAGKRSFECPTSPDSKHWLTTSFLSPRGGCRKARLWARCSRSPYSKHWFNYILLPAGRRRKAKPLWVWPRSKL